MLADCIERNLDPYESACWYLCATIGESSTQVQSGSNLIGTIGRGMIGCLGGLTVGVWTVRLDVTLVGTHVMCIMAKGINRSEYRVFG